MFFEHDLARPSFMSVVEIGEEEADSNGLDSFCLQLLDGAAHFSFVEREQYLPGGGDQAFCHDLPVASADQRPVLPGDVLHDRVILGSLVTGNVQDVAETAGRQHAGHGSVMLQQGIGGRRGAVEQVIDAARLGSDLLTQCCHAIDNASGRVIDRGGNLVDRHLLGNGVEVHQVSEGASDIDANQPHACPLYLYETVLVRDGPEVNMSCWAKPGELWTVPRRR